MQSKITDLNQVKDKKGTVLIVRDDRRDDISEETKKLLQDLSVETDVLFEVVDPSLQRARKLDEQNAKKVELFEKQQSDTAEALRLATEKLNVATSEFELFKTARNQKRDEALKLSRDANNKFLDVKAEVDLLSSAMGDSQLEVKLFQENKHDLERWLRNADAQLELLKSKDNPARAVLVSIQGNMLGKAAEKNSNAFAVREEQIKSSIDQAQKNIDATLVILGQKGFSIDRQTLTKKSELWSGIIDKCGLGLKAHNGNHLDNRRKLKKELGVAEQGRIPEDVYELVSQLVNAEQEIKSKNGELSNNNKAREAHIEKLNSELALLQVQLDACQSSIDLSIAAKEQEIATLDNDYLKVCSVLEEASTKVKEFAQTVESSNASLAEAKKVVEAREAELTEIEKANAEKIKELEDALAAKQSSKAELESKLVILTDGVEKAKLSKQGSAELLGQLCLYEENVKKHSIPGKVSNEFKPTEGIMQNYVVVVRNKAEADKIAKECAERYFVENFDARDPSQNTVPALNVSCLFKSLQPKFEHDKAAEKPVEESQENKEAEKISIVDKVVQNSILLRTPIANDNSNVALQSLLNSVKGPNFPLRDGNRLVANVVPLLKGGTFLVAENTTAQSASGSMYNLNENPIVDKEGKKAHRVIAGDICIRYDDKSKDSVHAWANKVDAVTRLRSLAGGFGMFAS